MLNPVGRRNPDSHPHESFRPYDRLVFFFLVHLTVRRLVGFTNSIVLQIAQIHPSDRITNPTGSSATTDHYGPA